VLVQSNSHWYFVKGTNEASTPAEAWRGLGFDASAWGRSPAPFFYGTFTRTQTFRTLLSDMRSHTPAFTCGKRLSCRILKGHRTAPARTMRRRLRRWINGVEI